MKNTSVALGQYIEIEIPYIFQDSDTGDEITYSAYMQNATCTSSKCISQLSDVDTGKWLTFDSLRNVLMGTPQANTDVTY